MKKRLLHVVLGFTIFLISSHQTYGQSNIKTVVINKGEVLDILLISQNPDTEADLNSYFQTAFPVAKRMSYQPLAGFKIVEHSQGNHLLSCRVICLAQSVSFLCFFPSCWL